MIIILHRKYGENLAINPEQIISVSETSYNGSGGSELRTTDGISFNIRESPEEVSAKIEGKRRK